MAPADRFRDAPDTEDDIEARAEDIKHDIIARNPYLIERRVCHERTGARTLQ